MSKPNNFTPMNSSLVGDGRMVLHLAVGTRCPLGHLIRCCDAVSDGAGGVILTCPVGHHDFLRFERKA